MIKQNVRRKFYLCNVILFKLEKIDTNLVKIANIKEKKKIICFTKNVHTLPINSVTDNLNSVIKYFKQKIPKFVILYVLVSVPQWIKKFVVKIIENEFNF